MLSESAYWCLGKVMQHGCYVKIYPYNWDSINFRFKPMTRWHHSVLHNIFALTMMTMLGFAGTRFILIAAQGNKNHNFPLVVKLVTSLWTFSYILATVCFIQFRVRRHQIMEFGNMLFASIRSSRKNRLKNTTSEFPPWNVEVSNAVLLSGFMLFINPPTHSAMMIDTPCAPHFVSSAWLSCGTTVENSNLFEEKIPFVLLETYFLVIKFSAWSWSFNWTMLYLGLAWMNEKMEHLRELQIKDIQSDNSTWKVAMKYRELQTIEKLLNTSLKQYLKWFPAIFLCIVSFLFFACIQFWGISIRIYAMFPFCALRCGFEYITPLALAGKVNKVCVRFLTQWKTRIGMEVRLGNPVTGHNKYSRVFRRSCKEVTVAAGDLFTFQNSIVLVTFHCVIELTLNLLLASKK